MQNCLLCKVNIADKRNSHIIPKFLCKGLFEKVTPRHSIEIRRNGRNKKIQDTPKEDNILCTACEKRLEILETMFAKRINKLHKYSDFPTKFKLKDLHKQKYLECSGINPTAFKLFIYSLVWRTSISKLYQFEKFKIPKSDEEILRSFLDINLKSTHKENLNTFDKINDVPAFHNCFIKPIEKSDESRGIFTAYNYAESSHIILVVDFAILFFTNGAKLDLAHKTFSNKQNEKVLVFLGSNDTWNDLNKLVVTTLFDKKSI
ncbi:hypothetical protein [uncultured Aquimarina sp.]|uniref:hypothetical protein n=1 Tax=uncultured Aquimarina sp. TaxID=575652 RepID=UPI00261DC7A2|nr:hypothetical protein [uncultured Aquimarina sp.]